MRVTLNQAEQAAKTVELWMSKDPEPRKKYITTNIKFTGVSD
jgi:DNA gyrase/topoisomerase IV subunit B